LGAYGISSLACQNDPNTSDQLDCGFELKDFFVHFKLVPKKKGGLLPNGWKLMDFFKLEINFFPHGKRMYIIVGNIFLVETKFFLHTFFVYCVQRVKCTNL
jgi:hypothetical protein